MSNTILIIGKSGSGKSRSILNLDPTETAIVNTIGKPLPFKGWKSKYKEVDKDGGNLFTVDDWAKVKKFFVYVDEKRPDIKTLIIDDFQYIMANEFMRRSSEKGYDKFNDIGTHAWQLLWDAKLLRQNLNVIFLSHSEQSDTGEIKAKTIGKMLDDRICLEGLFTVVLHSVISDGKYFFETQSNGQTTAKSPEGMFDEKLIENDLQKVINSIKEYEEE